MRDLNATTPLVRFRHALVFTISLLGLIIVGSALVVTRKANKYQVTQTADTAEVPVKTAIVTLEQLPLQITGAGTVEAYASAPVSSDVDGQLMELHFTAGQFVKKGEPLFTIDSRFPPDGFGHSRATQRGAADEGRLAEADLSKDLAEATAAEAEAKRYDGLYKDGVVSKEEDDRMRTIADDLEAVVKADQDARTSAQRTVSAAGMGLDTSTMQGDKAIRSPIDGLARNVAVKRGDTVFAGDPTPLVVIEQVIPIYVSFCVAETELPDIDRCMSQGEIKVTATVGNDAANPEQGTLGPIAFATISEDGTVSLRATFDNKDRRLQPGQPVNVVLSLMTANDGAVIPSSAVQTGEQGQYVFVVASDQTVEMRRVVVARTVGDKSVLTSRLESGEIVVTDAQFPLRSGSRVNASGDDE